LNRKARLFVWFGTLKFLYQEKQGFSYGLECLNSFTKKDKDFLGSGMFKFLFYKLIDF